MFLLQHWLDKAAAAVPEKAALVDSDGAATTYRQLQSQSRAIAHSLRSRSLAPSDRVAILQKRSSRVIASIFGTLYADGIYVPIHSASPSTRFTQILDICDAAAIICDKTTRALVEETLCGRQTAPAVLYVGAEDERGSLPIEWQFVDPDADTPAVDHSAAAIDVDAACLIFTSGSTGQPKGVAVTHRGIVDYMDWATRYFALSAEDRILGTAPFHFDMSTFDIHVTIRAQATLCIASDTDILFPGRLIAFIEREQPTIWKGVSSLLAYLAKTGELSSAQLSSLTRIVFSGEKLPTQRLIEWMSAVPKPRYFNAYGPTEATGISTCYEIAEIPASAEQSLPIGAACTNTHVFVIDENGRILEDGEVGELCIRGSGLALGYWRDTQLTRKKFVRLDDAKASYARVYHTGDRGYRDRDGLFHLVGRMDDQVKVQGYRIELGEVTHAVESCECVLAACTLCTELDGTASLVTFVELTGDSVTQGQLANDVRRRLPAYMLPSRFVIMDRLPRTDRGKIDKMALAELLQEPSDKLAALT